MPRLPSSFAVLLALLLTLALPGCSVTRTAEMALLGAANSPVPPHTHCTAFQPAAARLVERSPTVDITMESTARIDDLWPFFQAQFAARGWKLTEQYTRPDGTYAVDSYQCLDSRLILTLEEGQAVPGGPLRTKISIGIQTRHFWDWPSRWVQTGLVLALNTLGLGPGDPVATFLWSLP